MALTNKSIWYVMFKVKNSREKD